MEGVKKDSSFRSFSVLSMRSFVNFFHKDGVQNVVGFEPVKGHWFTRDLA